MVLRIFTVLIGVYTASVEGTYSIVGADRSEGLAGISIASCVGSLDLDIAVGMAPGHGVVAAQASVDSQFRGRTMAVELLRANFASNAIIDRITTSAGDPNPQSRQYGIAEISSSAGATSADWTGSSTGAWSGGVHGFDQQGRMPYAAQGNILTGPECVTQSEAGFIYEPERASNSTTKPGEHSVEDGCFDLPARLMRALIAGADNGEGDVRCTRRDPPVPVDSAYIRVDLPSGEPWLLLSVVDTYPLSAVDVLYAEYLLWRAVNPCSEKRGLEKFRANSSARVAAQAALRRHHLNATHTYLSAVRALGSNIDIVV